MEGGRGLATVTELDSNKDVRLTSISEVKLRACGLYGELKRDRVTTLAVAIAYNTVFALPAVILLTVMAAAVVNQVTGIAVTDHLRDLVRDHAPASTRQLLDDQVDNTIANVDGGGLSIGILVAATIALWSGSNAVGSLLNAFNLAYGVEETRSYKRKKLMTMGLTLALAIAVNLAFALLVFGHLMGEWWAAWVGAGSLFNIPWNLARWLAAVAVVGSFLSLLDYFGPDVRQSFRWITPGGALGTIPWLIATAGFGLCLRLSNPGSAHGVVGGVLVLLFFLYVSAIIFIAGAELNALLAGHKDKDLKQDS